MSAAGVLLTAPERRWVCSHCQFTDITHEAKPHSRMHSCKGMKLMTIPMMPDGTKAKVELVERDDWVGDELVQLDAEGRPWKSVVTTRDEGQDCAVFAATATAGVKDVRELIDGPRAVFV